MPLAIRCPTCNASLRVKEELAGKQGKCPSCGAVIRVPAVSGVAKAPSQDGTGSVANRSSTSRSPSSTDARKKSAPRRDPVQQPPGENSPAERGRATAASNVDGFQLPADGTTDERVSRYTARHQRRFEVPLRAWFAAAGVVFVIVTGFLGYRLVSRWHAAPDAASGFMDPLGDASHGGRASGARPVGRRAAGATGSGLMEDVYAGVEKGIVKIETFDDLHGRQALGTGFLIDPTGLVATSFHVVAYAANVEIQFSDGTRYGVEGYAAVNPQRDLAILKLDGVPRTARVLVLRHQDVPRKASAVYAVGHPYDHEFSLTTGIVSGVYQTTELPEESRSFLHARLNNDVENLWIQHDAKLSSGNSGGPLITTDGEVIGINSWVNQQTGLGYALHVRYLHELKGRMLERIAPLEEYRQAAPPTLDVAGVLELQVPTRPMSAFVREGSKIGWHPKNAEDYEALQELARAVTAVRFAQQQQNQDDTTSDAARRYARDADAAVAELAGVDWQSGSPLASINRFALEALQNPGEGVFVFGTVEDVFEGPDGRRGTLIQVIGSGQRMFVPLKRDFDPARGADYLILGLRFDSILNYGNNPLDPEEALVVLSRTFVEVELDDDDE